MRVWRVRLCVCFPTGLTKLQNFVTDAEPPLSLMNVSSVSEVETQQFYSIPGGKGPPASLPWTGGPQASPLHVVCALPQY